MGTRRGRPSRTALQENFRRDSAKTAEHFRRYPLRQPVDHQFEPYYQRFLKGDLIAALEYCDDHGTLDDSFYELIGRLVALQSWGAARQIVSEIQRRGFYLNDARHGGASRLPDEVIYRDIYPQLRQLCEVAREFIRERYKKDPVAKREQLWNEYVDGFYSPYFFSFPTLRSEQSSFKTSGDLKAWGETMSSHVVPRPGRREETLWDLVHQFSLHHLVPKPMFFELAETTKRADALAERDRRYHSRRFRSTPSMVARKYSAAMVGFSTSHISHKNRRT